MSRFYAIAWDLDGTLVDSEGLHQRALVESSATFGVDLTDLSEKVFLGIHVLDVWTVLRPRFPNWVERSAWLGGIERHYIAHVNDLQPNPDAVAAVLRLAARGIPQACISNSTRAIVDASLDSLGIRDRIAFSISLNEVSAGKPDPEPYRKAARQFALPAEAVVAVEDSPTGVRSAKNAGLYVLGYSPIGNALIECDLSIARLSEIPPMFNS